MNGCVCVCVCLCVCVYDPVQAFNVQSDSEHLPSATNHTPLLKNHHRHDTPITATPITATHPLFSPIKSDHRLKNNPLIGEWTSLRHEH